MLAPALRPGLGLLLVSLLAVLLTGCQPRPPTATRLQGKTMGTYYSLTLPGGYPGGAPALKREIDTLLGRMNKEISTYDPDALISRFNQGPVEPAMEIPAEMARIVQQGIDAGHLTQGKLDVTIGPLVNLWGFGPDKRPVKTPSEADRKSGG